MAFIKRASTVAAHLLEQQAKYVKNLEWPSMEP